MDKIKFGTDGWRAVIAKDFTFENIARLSVAIAKWLNNSYNNPTVVIGYDCRFGGKMFSELVACILAKKNIKCYLSDHFASTPEVSFEVIKHKADLGIVITASHNPPVYNGIKLKGSHGGPLMEEHILEVERKLRFNENVLKLLTIKYQKAKEIKAFNSAVAKLSKVGESENSAQ